MPEQCKASESPGSEKKKKSRINSDPVIETELHASHILP